MTPGASSGVAELVTERPARAAVFERLGIDYWRDGGVSLEVACGIKGIDLDRVLDELQVFDAVPRGEDEPPLTEMGLTELCDHIETTHHAFMREALSRISEQMDTVVATHGNGRPALSELRTIFMGFRSGIEQHLEKEEQILFPLCREMERSAETTFHCGSVENPVRVMMMEHEDADGEMVRMHRLTEGFLAPTDADETWTAMLGGLKEMVADLHRHVHKENYVLFPKAIAAEEGVSAGPGCVT